MAFNTVLLMQSLQQCSTIIAESASSTQSTQTIEGDTSSNTVSKAANTSICKRSANTVASSYSLWPNNNNNDTNTESNNITKLSWLTIESNQSYFAHCPLSSSAIQVAYKSVRTMPDTVPSGCQHKNDPLQSCAAALTQMEQNEHTSLHKSAYRCKPIDAESEPANELSLNPTKLQCRSASEGAPPICQNQCPSSNIQDLVNFPPAACRSFSTPAQVYGGGSPHKARKYVQHSAHSAPPAPVHATADEKVEFGDSALFERRADGRLARRFRISHLPANITDTQLQQYCQATANIYDIDIVPAKADQDWCDAYASTHTAETCDQIVQGLNNQWYGSYRVKVQYAVPQAGKDSAVLHDQLFVSNLCYDITEDQLNKVFQSYGCKKCSINRKDGKAIAYLTFQSPNMAQHAMKTFRRQANVLPLLDPSKGLVVNFKDMRWLQKKQQDKSADGNNANSSVTANVHAAALPVPSASSVPTNPSRLPDLRSVNGCQQHFFFPTT